MYVVCKPWWMAVKSVKSRVFVVTFWLCVCVFLFVGGAPGVQAGATSPDLPFDNCNLDTVSDHELRSYQVTFATDCTW